MTPIRLLVVFLLFLSATSARAQFGIIADDATDSAIVFDAATDTVLGSVLIGPGTAGGGIGDCAITGDQTLGMVTDNQNQLWFIDLTPPRPAWPPARTHSRSRARVWTSRSARSRTSSWSATEAASHRYRSWTSRAAPRWMLSIWGTTATRSTSVAMAPS